MAPTTMLRASAVLAAARWFRAHPPRQSVLFVAFDGEEQGLQGARQFVANPPVQLDRVSTVVNMDMIGRGDKNVLFVAGTHHYPELKPAVEDAAKGRPIAVTFGHDQPGLRQGEDWTQSSDHGPFHAARVPFLYFGVEDHPDYHKPTDTADKIPAAVLPRSNGAGARHGADVSPTCSASGAPATPAAQGGPLTPDEQAIVAHVDAANAQALALLERVVNINSGTQNFAGVRAVGRRLPRRVRRARLQDALGRRRARSSAPAIWSPSTRAGADASCSSATSTPSSSPTARSSGSSASTTRARAGPASST